MSDEIVLANIAVHTRVASRYNSSEPHFRPENQEKVKGILRDLSQRCGGGKLLDLGCGTGFILKLAQEYFTELHGVDVTQAMLDQVDTTSGKIHLHNAQAEALPFPSETFNLVSAYSFIHHAKDYMLVLKEAARVLKPGGICYVDLEPNKLFWEAISKIDKPTLDSGDPLVRKAYDSVVNVDEKLEKEYGIPRDVTNKAEYGKSILGGIDPDLIQRQVRQLGFKDCKIRFEWFVGQAEVMHGQSFADAALIDAHLRRIAPLSNHLFKYIQLILTK